MDSENRAEHEVPPSGPRRIPEGQRERHCADDHHRDVLLNREAGLQRFHRILFQFVPQPVRVGIHQGEDGEYGCESDRVDPHQSGGFMLSDAAGNVGTR